MTTARPDPADPLHAVHALAAGGEAVRAFACLERVLATESPERSRAAEADALAAVARCADRAGETGIARAALDAALARVDWADLHLARGTLLVRAGERDAARRAFDRALAINPRYRAAALERALLDAREGRITEALGALHALTGGSAPANDAELEAGLERLRQAQVDVAAPLLRRALAERDEALESRLAEAQSLLAAGETGPGLARLREAVAAHPGYADLHALLGSHELRAGLLDDGLDSLVRALELNPGFHAARLELARGLEARGERERALAQVRSVLEHEPAHPEAASFYERLTLRRRGPAAA